VNIKSLVARYHNYTRQRLQTHEAKKLLMAIKHQS